MSDTCDLVVLGLGPGGEAVATGAARAGLRVVAVDKHLVGGECPYYGCVPSKMMVRAGDVLAEAGRIGQLAGSATVEASWAPVAARIAEQATDHWDDTVAVERLRDAGATVVHGTGRLAGPGRVEVELPDGSRTTYDAGRGVVLNPGTRPAVLPVPGLEGTPFWTNREAVKVTSLPSSLAVIGGGPIGCEMAQVFARFGVRVTVLEGGPRILGPLEPEASAALGEVFAHEGSRSASGRAGWGHAAGCTGRAATGCSSWSPTPSAASSWGPPSWVRTPARCWVTWRWPCTPRCRSPRCAR